MVRYFYPYMSNLQGVCCDPEFEGTSGLVAGHSTFVGDVCAWCGVWFVGLKLECDSTVKISRSTRFSPGIKHIHLVAFKMPSPTIIVICSICFGTPVMQFINICSFNAFLFPSLGSCPVCQVPPENAMRTWLRIATGGLFGQTY